MVLKMKSNRTGVVKVLCKSSGKSCSGKTNIRTIFFGDKASQVTVKQIYDVGSIEKALGTILGNSSTNSNLKFIYQFQPETKTLIKNLKGS